LTIDLDAQGTLTLYVGDIMRRSLVVSLAVLAIVKSPAMAQTCQGMASFSAGKMQVNAGGRFSSAVNSWGGGLSYGLPSGLYAGAQVSTTSFDGIDQHSLGIGANAGYEMKVGSKANGMSVCPVASLQLGMGPDDKANDINSSSTDAHFGLALGKQMGATPQLRIIPTAGLGLQYSKAKVEDTAPGGTTLEASDTYGLATLGLGLVFNQQISVRPSVDIPLGLDNSDATFGITVGYNFGSTRSVGRRH
jgi:outer membrane autotransporter protein